MAALRETLAEAGVPAPGLAALRAPAGLDLGAITPDKIAFSIVAEMIQVRRRGQCGVRQKYQAVVTISPEQDGDGCESFQA